MESDANDFEEGALQLQYISANVFDAVGSSYVVMFHVADNKKSVTLQVTDGLQYAWIVQLERRHIDAIRKDMGLATTYKQFFKSLKEVFQDTKTCVTIAKDIRTCDLVIGLKFKIGIGGFLEHSLKICKPLDEAKDGILFRETLQTFVLNLQKAKQKEFEILTRELKGYIAKNENLEKELNTIKIQRGIALGPPEVGPVNDSKSEAEKRKAKTNLVNPNMKRKRGGGAKIGTQD